MDRRTATASQHERVRQMIGDRCPHGSTRAGSARHPAGTAPRPRAELRSRESAVCAHNLGVTLSQRVSAEREPRFATPAERRATAGTTADRSSSMTYERSLVNKKELETRCTALTADNFSVYGCFLVRLSVRAHGRGDHEPYPLRKHARWGATLSGRNVGRGGGLRA